MIYKTSHHFLVGKEDKNGILWQVLSWEYSPSPQASTHWPWWSRSPGGHKVHWETEGPQQDPQELWHADEMRKSNQRSLNSEYWTVPAVREAEWGADTEVDLQHNQCRLLLSRAQLLGNYKSQRGELIAWIKQLKMVKTSDCCCCSLTSAPALLVHVMLSRTLANTFPIMHCFTWRAAHTGGVVRETGGTGCITGCEKWKCSLCVKC